MSKQIIVSKEPKKVKYVLSYHSALLLKDKIYSVKKNNGNTFIAFINGKEM